MTGPTVDGMAERPAAGGFATSEAVRQRMSRQRSQDTGPELQLRQALFRLGLRYRLHRRPDPSVRRVADIVFVSPKVAVFVDGCFWHRCPEHGTTPSVNVDYWQAKLDGNVTRDRDTDRRLEAAGWRVIRVWEHEDPDEAAARIARVVRRRAAQPHKTIPSPRGGR